MPPENEPANKPDDANKPDGKTDEPKDDALEAAEAAKAAAEAKEAADKKAADDKAAEDALGDAGKKALDSMKAEKKAAKEELAKEKARADALQAKIDGKEAEHAEQEKTRAAEVAALAKADERILKAEVRAAAAGKLSDPKDALLHIDLSEFEVDSDGAIDGDKIAQAIDDLIKNKPYLAAQGGGFGGSADGGPRNETTTRPKSLGDAVAAHYTK